jgi:hypothetical protein
VGERAFARNPADIYGTLLRDRPHRPPHSWAHLNGQSVANDTEVEVVQVSDEFALVRTVANADSPSEGWLRQHNLARSKVEDSYDGKWPDLTQG